MNSEKTLAHARIVLRGFKDVRGLAENRYLVMEETRNSLWETALKMAQAGEWNPPARDGSLGLVARYKLSNPGIENFISDQGFDARTAGKPMSENPYTEDGLYGFWQRGWEIADYNLRQEPLDSTDSR